MSFEGPTFDFAAQGQCFVRVRAFSFVCFRGSKKYKILRGKHPRIHTNHSQSGSEMESFFDVVFWWIYG